MSPLRLILTSSNIMQLKDEIKAKNKAIARIEKNQSALYAFIFKNLSNEH